MGIILLEPSNTGQTRKGAGDFISMQHAKVSVSNWEVSETSDLVVKHKAMAWAVHRFHSETLAFNLPHKHVFFVGRVVT
jgi:hypothetical protein